MVCSLVYEWMNVNWSRGGEMEKGRGGKVGGSGIEKGAGVGVGGGVGVGVCVCVEVCEYVCVEVRDGWEKRVHCRWSALQMAAGVCVLSLIHI